MSLYTVDSSFAMQVDEDEKLTLIDFPQMVSVGHGNARELFYRDVECIIRYHSCLRTLQTAIMLTMGMGTIIVIVYLTCPWFLRI